MKGHTTGCKRLDDLLMRACELRAVEVPDSRPGTFRLHDLVCCAELEPGEHIRMMIEGREEIIEDDPLDGTYLWRGCRPATWENIARLAIRLLGEEPGTTTTPSECEEILTRRRKRE